jgi:hypothetical protein
MMSAAGSIEKIPNTTVQWINVPSPNRDGRLVAPEDTRYKLRAVSVGIFGDFILKSSLNK